MRVCEPLVEKHVSLLLAYDPMPTAIFDEYRDRLERRRRDLKTISQFDIASRRWLEHCVKNGIDPERVQPIDFERYFDELPFKPSTKHGYFKHLRAVYRYAQSRGVITADPTIDVELPREPDKTPRTIPLDVLRTSKRLVQNNLQLLLFNLCAYTGARQFEITKMRWEDIDLQTRTIEIIGKGGKRRLVPIHPALGEVLAALKTRDLVFPGRNDGLADPHTMRYRLTRFIPEYGFHDFRRTVASSLDANGVGRSEIDEIMGWAPRTIFERHYRRVAPERLQQAILKLYADDPL
jgi:integrase